jgi:hypothetical protein
VGNETEKSFGIAEFGAALCHAWQHPVKATTHVKEILKSTG